MIFPRYEKVTSDFSLVEASWEEQTLMDQVTDGQKTNLFWRAMNFANRCTVSESTI